MSRSIPPNPSSAPSLYSGAAGLQDHLAAILANIGVFQANDLPALRQTIFENGFHAAHLIFGHEVKSRAAQHLGPLIPQHIFDGWLL